MRVRDAAEALERANACDYGLNGSIWSKDLARASRSLPASFMPGGAHLLETNPGGSISLAADRAWYTRQGLWSDASAQIVSLPLLAVAAFRLKALPTPSKLRLPLFLIFALVLVPVLQLVPLPPRLWTILPGRGEVAEAYTAAGMSLPFLPISLEPLTTLRSLLSLLPAVAVFLGVFCLREEAELRWVLLLIFSVAIVGAGLELMQLVGGVHSPLRFYEFTNEERGVGFFANSNHQAAFLYGAIPYAATWAILARQGSSASRAFRLTISAILLIFLVVGIGQIDRGQPIERELAVGLLVDNRPARGSRLERGKVRLAMAERAEERKSERAGPHVKAAERDAGDRSKLRP